MGSPSPGLDLYRKVRAGFIVNKETTLKAWCRKNGVHVTGARQALIGTWNGPKGQALRGRICKAAGVNGDAP